MRSVRPRHLDMRQAISAAALCVASREVPRPRRPCDRCRLVLSPRYRRGVCPPGRGPRGSSTRMSRKTSRASRTLESTAASISSKLPEPERKSMDVDRRVSTRTPSGYAIESRRASGVKLLMQGPGRAGPPGRCGRDGDPAVPGTPRLRRRRPAIERYAPSDALERAAVPRPEGAKTGTGLPPAGAGRSLRASRRSSVDFVFRDVRGHTEQGGSLRPVGVEEPQGERKPLPRDPAVRRAVALREARRRAARKWRRSRSRPGQTGAIVGRAPMAGRRVSCRLPALASGRWRSPRSSEPAGSLAFRP